MRWLWMGAATLLLLSSTGCLSMASNLHAIEEPQAPMPMSGTMAWWEVVRAVAKEGDFIAVLGGIPALIDLPMELGLDLSLLPITTPLWLIWGG